jgi:two-component system, OmpR family, sensor histidine kinase KdpD
MNQGKPPAILRRPSWTHAVRRIYPYLAGAASVVAVGLLAKLLQLSFVTLPNVSLIFLLAVLVSAVRWGLGPSIVAAVLGVLAYDFLFVSPVHTFIVDSPQDLLALAIFLGVAILTSNLAARVRAQAEAAAERERQTAALYALSRQLASSAGIDNVILAIVSQVAQMTGAWAAVFLPEDGLMALKATSAPGAQPDGLDQAAAALTWREGQAITRPTSGPGAGRWVYLPLSTAQKTVGVLGLFSHDDEDPVSAERRRLLDALAGQAAVAIERPTLAQEMAQAKLLAETERLRTALLSSISHDLRTPLASITGAVTSLLRYRANYDEETQNDLLQTIHEEAERLDRFVGNLLNMTRLESGALQLNRDWVALDDIIGSTLARLARPLAAYQVCLETDRSLPLLWLDFVLMEQVFVNLLDNAMKYSHAGTTIRIGSARKGDRVDVQIVDEGIGVPPADLERIFRDFYRVPHSDRVSAGTGLGLSICRGIVEAHGGQVSAHVRVEGPGTVFVLELPILQVPALEAEAEDVNE